ncbi:hypothetical protein F404_gp056 [Vibrio phage pVp-1]|uniref:PD(D/E)XK endonuclease domain-containing protein n=1 Tax=Vibrio phage pVp-1 TaxID=1150989 RepID=H6WXE7_9CAUD|nr:hypothetical protein F404_gp056 [Vibrio phage pVp-1]AFB83913.1 hypothetical protein pVp-1_0056 [Vibrio phage pVp-1]QQO38447.1 hypothetical protein VPG01_089 [Vibrio phage VPG01]
MDSTFQGYIGEMKAKAYFAALGYYVFSDDSGNSPVDFLVMKDGIVKKVQVKSTRGRNKADTGWEVQLKSVRTNKTANKVKHFDNTAQDFLFVYFPEIDKYKLLISSEITQKAAMLVKDIELR